MATFWAVSCLIIGIAFAISERSKIRHIAQLIHDTRYWRQTALDATYRLKEADLIQTLGKREDVDTLYEKVNIHARTEVAAQNIATMLSAAGYGVITQGDNDGTYWFEVKGQKEYNVFYPGDAS